MDFVSKRYGSALFDTSKDYEKIEVILEQLRLLKKILDQNGDAYKILEHPNVSVAEKQGMIEELFSDIFDAEIISLMKLLVEKGRVDHLNGIIDSYEELYMSYCNIVKAYVTSAKQLTPVQKQKLVSQLARMIKKTITVEYNIDETLLGGLLIKVEDKIIDATVKGKLESLKSELLYDAF